MSVDCDHPACPDVDLLLDTVAAITTSVEVLGRYSNPRSQSRELQKLLAMTPVGCPVAAVPSRQRQHRLRKEEIDVLTAKYERGAATVALAYEYGINLTTVLSHIDRAGIVRKRLKIDDQDLHEVVRRYRSGETIVPIARQFEVSPETVRRALLRGGVKPRGRRRRG